MPIIVFIGAMLLASVLESAIHYGLKAVKAKQERRDAVQEECMLSTRYLQLNSELNRCA